MTIFAMSWEAFFLNPAVVWVLIPIAMIGFSGVKEIYKQYCRHQERMGLIEAGIHPDVVTDDAVSETQYHERSA